MPARPQPPNERRWLWTCRAGFEAHLFEELGWAGASPRLLGAALLESSALRAGTPSPAFARAGFRMDRVIRIRPAEVDPESAAADPERPPVDRSRGEPPTAESGGSASLAAAAPPIAPAPAGGTTSLAAAVVAAAVELAGSEPVHLHVWTADTPQGNALASIASDLEALLRAALGGRALESFAAARERGALLQLCVLGPDLAALGVQRPADALSPAPGGRQRMWRESSTSRASMKLEEALESLSLSPGRGEVCVDLGAAPGGWTERLLQRGAKVIAVDPANLAPHLIGHGKLRHVKDSAFAYEPEEPADWLFCDMAWRPLEVAQLLAKWGRRGWASQLVANFKLPMKDKNPILHRVRFILEQHGGWRGLKIRQLYHDRDEVTVTAFRAAGA